MKIEQNIIDILKQGKFENGIYYLPQITLDRKTYLQVNEVLENAGGKWNKKEKGHIFQSDPSKLWTAIESGETVNEKKLYQFFETPKEIVRQIIELAEIKDGMLVLEPSAGHGSICDELSKNIELKCVEIDSEKYKVLKEKGYNCENIDFIDYNFNGFDRIIMNPPFTKGQDATHVLHAYNLLKEGGRLVSVMSNSITFNSQNKYKVVRDLIDKNGEIIELPEDSFKESGTKVRTVLVVINKD